MKSLASICSVAILGLSGCVAQETFVQNNMVYSDFEKDRAECETQATQAVPVNRSPGAEIAVALLTGVYSVNDANAPARIRNYEACMMSRGYQRVQLQYCTNAQEAQQNGVGPLRGSERVVISSETCIVNDRLGRQVFYTPAESAS